MRTKGANGIMPCRDCPLRRLQTYRAFGPDELAFVQKFKAGELDVRAGETILSQGEASDHLFTMLSGWAFRYKLLPDGRRQILNFALPGDLIGLQGAAFDKMEHSVEALTPSVLCVFPREKLWSLYERYSSLAFDVTWLAAREECMLGEHLLSVGRRSALERVAFLLLHLYLRAQRAGLGHGKSAPFPLTQQHLADALGLSLVHTNKTLRRLRRTNAFAWTNGDFQLLDEEKLAQLAREPPSISGLRPFI
jgi:CRP/FNR family transcriptional regulator